MKEDKFVAYVIHAPEKDDYLMSIKSTKTTDERSWCRLPQLAKRFGKREAAEKFRSRLNVPYKTEVWELWESETQFMTSKCDDQ